MSTLYGYTLDEIDEIGNELFSILADQGMPVRLSVLGLCKAITLVGTDEDLDLACVIIDRLAELNGRKSEDT